MEITELIQLVSGQGLAVAMCIAFFWQSTKQTGQIISSMTSLSEKMMKVDGDNEKMLSALNTLINCVDRLADRIETWDKDLK